MIPPAVLISATRCTVQGGTVWCRNSLRGTRIMAQFYSKKEHFNGDSETGSGGVAEAARQSE
jgi:hypothetical protein